jgi:hypothetical protein
MWDHPNISLHNPESCHISFPDRDPSCLIPHRFQVLNNGEVRIQEPVDTILCAALLVPIKFPASDRPRHAFLPADVGQGVHSYQHIR